MSLSVKFNGFELNRILDVLKGFDREVGTSKSVGLEKIGRSRGKKFVYTSAEEGNIKMPFRFNTDINEKRRELAAILDVTEPKELIFGDEPDKVYYALPTSDIPLSEIVFLGKGTINWIVPDGLAHSTAQKPFTTYMNDNGVMEMKVINNGTVPVPISFEATMTSDNGYFGVASEYGAMQFGDITEVDGTMVETPRSKTLLTFNNLADWDKMIPATINRENSNKKTGLTMGVRQDVFNTALGNLSGTMQTTGIATGGLRGANFEPSRNVYLWFRYWFETGRMGQTGTSSLSLIAEDNSLIASVIVEKQDTAGNQARVIFKVGGANPRQLLVIPFQPTHWNTQNPITWIDGGGPMDLRKVGSKITFYWWGRYYTFDIAEFADVKASRVEYYAGQWNGRNLTNQRVDFMHLRRLSVTQLNVEEWRNDPNRYSVDDVLYIDGEGPRKQAYINGMPTLGDEVVGTKYFKVPPGETIINFYYSDFATAPVVKGYIREAWT